jgi:enoyl-CoA hydratase/carnithine racemase
MNSDLVLVDRSGPAALVTLNRPDKRNALSVELRVVLAETLEALADDTSVAAIGLTGAGSAFCSGMDVTQFGGDTAHKRQLVETSVRAFDAVAECPKPTVALVNGAAVAGGFALALLCDVRVAAQRRALASPNWGCTSTVVFAPVVRGIGASGAWCTSTVVFAPVVRGIGASGAWCTSTVVFAPVANPIGGSGA